MKCLGMAVLLTLCGFTHAAEPEVRGTWLTTTGLSTGNLSSNNVTAQTYQRLRNTGLNSTYSDLWRAGYTQFSSPSMQSLIGVAKDPAIGSRDIARETTLQAHRQGMLNIGWFQYGFAAIFGNPSTSSGHISKYMADRGWLLKDSTGNYTNSSNSFSWMNPLVPEVRSLLTNIVLDAVKQYDLDGIQFDDRLAWPVQFGYDDHTRNVYLQETGNPVPASYSDVAFKAWRAHKVTAFAQQLIADVKAHNPALIVSVAPSVYPFSYDNYCVDWPAWVSSGMFDEIIPQVYRNTSASFDASWDGTGSITTGGQAQFFGSRRGDFAAGISINTSSGTPNPWSELQPMVQQVRSTSGVGGHVWWYSAGALSYESELTSYYNVAANGQAPRPDVPQGWRPTPIRASPQNATVWSAPIAQKRRYWIVYQTPSGWFELANTVLFPGNASFNVSGASAVEVLVDRRFVDGDINLDLIVNSTDFSILLSRYGTTGNSWSQGDLNGDSRVNALDFNILAGNFGRRPSLTLPAPVPGAPVPEPAGSAAMLMGAVILWRRK